MTNKEIIDLVTRYQQSKFVHPLTCGNDSRHEILVPIEVNNYVILKCPDCEYIQSWIPMLPDPDILKEYIL